MPNKSNSRARLLFTRETPRTDSDIERDAFVGPTAKALSCAATAHVPKLKRHAACLHVRRAMQAA